MMEGYRQFPILRSGHHPTSKVPWWLAEIAYEGYVARFGDRQSLEMLAERGGFGRNELVMFIRKEAKDNDFHEHKE
jgi:hypothetical protein